MTKIRFSNGSVVNFDGDPTPEDIEEISSQFGSTTPQPRKNPLLGLAKSFITPTISPEPIEKRVPVSAGIGSMIPIFRMLSGEPNQAVLPTNLIRAGAEELSSQTSPAAMVGNLGMGLGTLRKMGKLPQIFNKQYTLRQAQLTSDELGTLRTTLGEQKKAAISRVGDVVVNTNEVPMTNLPKTAQIALDDPLYAIERTKNGTIRPTVANLDRVKEALGDLMTAKTWDESTKKSQQIIKQVYGKLNNAMKKAARDAGNPIDDALDAYHNFMNDYSQVIRTVEDTAGNIVEQPLRRTFRPLAERGKVEAYKRLADISPQIAQVVKNMNKYTGRQITKGVVGAAGGTGLGLYLLHNYLANLLRPRQ